jgi:hypothetical protein
VGDLITQFVTSDSDEKQLPAFRSGRVTNGRERNSILSTQKACSSFGMYREISAE